MAKMKGFFSDKDLKKVGLNGPSSSDCEKCGLYRSCKTPRMPYTGQGKLKALIIAEAPGEEEDLKGVQLIGKPGKFLREKLKEKGFDLDRDFWKTNAVTCHPPNDDKPTRQQLKCCYPNLERTLDELKPRFIILCGDSAITTYFMEMGENHGVNTWRGMVIPDQEREAWVMPIYHPSYLLRNEKDEHLQATFDRDLTKVLTCLSYQEVPQKINLKKHIRPLRDYMEVCNALKKAEKEAEYFCFDYEATGLKPFKSGHKIVMASFCYDGETAYSFPWDFNDFWKPNQLYAIGELWKRILVNPKIKKIAHNHKFEHMWTRKILNYEVENWYWCSMVTAHILDCREGITGLKFQSLIRWGIPDYSKDVERYLKSIGKSGFNTILKAPLKELLDYSAIDSLTNFWLLSEQMDEIEGKKGLERARKFFLESADTLSDVQYNGIAMNDQYYLDTDKELEDRLLAIEESLKTDPDIIKFERIEGRPIKLTSDFDLRKLFFKQMGLTAPKKTGTGLDSVDASVLLGLDAPIAKKLVEKSKLEKVKGTYLAQFIRESNEGRMYPFFDLHIPTTYRGSSSKPNFQNVPIRDEEAKMLTRAGIMPSPGNILLDFDYGAMEVRIIACYTLDPTLIANIDDPHTAWALELFGIEEKEWKKIPKKYSKKIRFDSKNGFVFPEFYGSYYKSCARNLFQTTLSLEISEGYTVREHLESVGIIRQRSLAYEQFEEHIKGVEKKFWDMFPKVKKWQEETIAGYLKNGYVEQMFGFRCSGYLTRNDCVNWPVQGTAFHCLLYTMNNIKRQLRERQMRSFMNGQIHDCCLYDAFVSEKQKLMELSEYVATKQIREELSWIVVPLIIEWEATEVDCSWATKKEIFYEAA